MSFYYQKKHKCHSECKEEKRLDRVLKEDCKSKGGKGKTAVDFEYFVNNPNIFSDTTTQSLTDGVETTVAVISFKDVQKRSNILLQALAHLIAEDGNTVIVRIRKFDNGTPMLPTSGDLIYETPEIVMVAGANQVAALHVDNDFSECEENVTYLLTLEVAGAAILLARPLTFTGTEFN